MQDDKFAVWATMEVRPGLEQEARVFLIEASRRLSSEPGTTSFRAMDLGDGKFAIFNTFTDHDAVMAHVNGPVAQWVQESRITIFVNPYDITRCEIFATMKK